MGSVMVITGFLSRKVGYGDWPPRYDQRCVTISMKTKLISKQSWLESAHMWAFLWSPDSHGLSLGVVVSQFF
jgi:hypothetical protein